MVNSDKQITLKKNFSLQCFFTIIQYNIDPDNWY